MASFIGSNKEFHRYIGPRLRNLVHQFTKKHKENISVCEYCGSKDNLESAHVHGRDRNKIINLILNEYTYNDIVTVDIVKFEELFKKEHQPLEKSILILCRSCHKQYDSKAPIEITAQKSKTPASNPSIINNEKTTLPITLEPSDPNTFQQELLLSKQAIIEIYYSNGKIKQKEWNASRFLPSSKVFTNLRSRREFRSGNWQKNGIVKVHVRITKNT